MLRFLKSRLAKKKKKQDIDVEFKPAAIDNNNNIDELDSENYERNCLKSKIIRVIQFNDGNFSRLPLDLFCRDDPPHEYMVNEWKKSSKEEKTKYVMLAKNNARRENIDISKWQRRGKCCRQKKKICKPKEPCCGKCKKCDKPSNNCGENSCFNIFAGGN